VESVVRFVVPGLRADERALVVATADHLAQVEAALLAQGFATAALCERGDLVLVDADEVLSDLLVDGMPDRQRFAALVERSVGAAWDDGRRIRVFGEMVALLWDQGNVAAVLELESLWNELLKTQPFALFCAYPMRAFGREEDEAAFHDVCDAHSVVLPSERYSHLEDPDQRSRAVAILQHEAIVGINERIALRQALHQRDVELERLRALDRLRARLVSVLTPDSPAADPAGRRSRAARAVDTVGKTACRQVSGVLGVKCSFVEGLPDDAPDVVANVVRVPVTDGNVTHGVLRVDLPPSRILDDDELTFLRAAAGTMAAAFAQST
jgi:hypothetical protein